jgi:two-component system phosphate regulon sensor histidine kinase PhoR
MGDGVARKLGLITAAAVALPLIFIQLGVSSVAVRIASMAWGVALILAAWLYGRWVSRRIHGLTAFADRLLEVNVPRPRLPSGDDEFGALSRSLSHVAPQIEELVNRLRTELTRREAILASMTEGVLAVDARLNVTFCNEAFLRAVGDRGSSDGTALIKVVRDPVLFQMLKRVVDSGEALRQRLQLSSLETRSFEVYAAPLAGAPARGVLAILHDVTPAERLERVKRDFIANVSHEMRTPLATIRGYAETLLEGGLEDTQNRRKFVEIIQANGVRLNNIVADFLTLSELESGRPEIQPGPVSVGDVVSGAIRAVEPAASLMGVRLQAAPVPDLRLMGYGIRLEQALLNLLDNAVKFNRPDGEVHVQVVAGRSGKIEIRVSDTGVGIPPEDLSRIFERFYRVDKARSRQVGGTGLGLSIVKHAVEQMHGSVTVESELGKGTTFTVSLPQYYDHKPSLTV